MILKLIGLLTNAGLRKVHPEKLLSPEEKHPSSANTKVMRIKTQGVAQSHTRR